MGFLSEGFRQGYAVLVIEFGSLVQTGEFPSRSGLPPEETQIKVIPIEQFSELGPVSTRGNRENPHAIVNPSLCLGS